MSPLSFAWAGETVSGDQEVEETKSAVIDEASVEIPSGSDVEGAEPGGEADDTGGETPPVAEERPRLSYSAHVGSVGWQKAVGEGESAGTVGRSLAMEALRIDLPENVAGSIRYRVSAYGKGWMPESSDGEVAGTTGESRQIETLTIHLDGELATDYNIRYRVHVSNLGWLGWAENGEKAGTAGYGYAIEAIEIQFVPVGSEAPEQTGPSYRRLGDVAYDAHVSNVGWQSWQADGGIAGTTGRSCAIEAFKVSVPDLSYEGDVVYSAHVADVGWQPEVSNGTIAGTVGQSRPMEAVTISLTGELANHYDIYYQVHVQNYGWLDWASDGAKAGSEGLGFRAEAVRIRLVEKGGAAPGPIDKPFVSSAFVSYCAHVGGIGWQDWVNRGTMAGTTGASRAIEALQMKLDSVIAGGIRYQLHVQDIGWQNAVLDGAVAGTTGRSLQAEAVTISLTGEAARYYDVYYRVHSQDYGWLGWACNGGYAGTTNCSYRMEALQVVVVGKGGDAPGSTVGAYKDTPAIPLSYQTMARCVNGTSSPTGWLLAVDTQNCLVGVYHGSRGNWSNTMMYACAPGAWSTPTVKGIFSVGLKGYSFGSGYTCYYWTQFYGDYLFHSVLYYQGTRTILDGTLGRPASHGCVRLAIENAKWIYDTIPRGTTVIVY